MNVVSFSGFLPLPRYDGVPWSSAKIQESIAETGPWNDIETFSLTPLDPDPAQPMPRNFTTDLATIPSGGWYRIVFSDSIGAQELPTIPVQNIPEDRPEYWPSLETVGAILRSRTVEGETGAEVGTFTAKTTPTASEMEQLIGTGARDLSIAVGADIPDSLIPEAERLVAIRAAMLTELSYFPEQVASNRSPYDHYRQLWVDAIGTPANPGVFVLAVRGTEEDPDDPTGVGMPHFGFPTTDLVGWETRW